MAEICPTITVESKIEYERQLSNVSAFAKRIHIDLADGVFAPRPLLDVSAMSWSQEMQIDLHVMYQRPDRVIDNLDRAYKPGLVIVHAEAEGDFLALAFKLKQLGIKCGVALMQTTEPALIKPVIGLVDHVLIFSGNLGYQGGSSANLNLLDKIKALKEWKPKLEIGWDGGVDDHNIIDLVKGGVDVINVGGYIQSAKEPERAYAKLRTALEGSE